MSIRPHPKRPDRVSSPPSGAGPGLSPPDPRRRRFRSQASDWNLGFWRGALHSCSPPPPERSAVEPGDGRMGNVG